MNCLPYTTSSTLGFGIYTALAPLPDGWRWIQKRNDWLLARDPFGRFWYVDFPASGGLLMVLRESATAWDWLRTWGALKPGMFYADHRFTMFFPRQQTRS